MSVDSQLQRRHPGLEEIEAVAAVGAVPAVAAVPAVQEFRAQEGEMLVESMLLSLSISTTLPWLNSRQLIYTFDMHQIQKPLHHHFTHPAEVLEPHATYMRKNLGQSQKLQATTS